MKVYVLPHRSAGIDTTSRGAYAKQLSPFYLGGCYLYGVV